MLCLCILINTVSRSVPLASNMLMWVGSVGTLRICVLAVGKLLSIRGGIVG